MKATKDNFHKLGYKNVLDACHVEWSLVEETKKIEIQEKERIKGGESLLSVHKNLIRF